MHGRLLTTLCLGLLLLCPASRTLAQSEGAEEREEELETDRDSFTPATTLVAPQRWIIESAYSFIDNRDVQDTHSLPELIARYGLSDWLELRLGWNYEVGGASNGISGGISDPVETEEAELERESLLSYGFKAALTCQDRWVPESAFILQAGTPTSGADTATQLFATYVFGWVLPNEWTWDTSLRYGFDTAEGDHFNVWAPSTVLKVPFGEQWKAHVEYFAICSDGREDDRSQHYFSPGVHYLVTPDFEVGIRVGWGLNDDAANFFSNVGVGWQF